MLHSLSRIQQVGRGDIRVRHLRLVSHLHSQGSEFDFQKKLDVWRLMHGRKPSRDRLIIVGTAVRLLVAPRLQPGGPVINRPAQCRTPSCWPTGSRVSPRPRLGQPAPSVHDTFRISVRRTKSWRVGRHRWHNGLVMNQDVSLGDVRPLSRLRSICASRQPSREVPEVLLEKVVRRQAKLEFDVLTDLHLRVAEAFGAASHSQPL
jgi:hypothetical protein